jgi:hypothetical protein
MIIDVSPYAYQLYIETEYFIFINQYEGAQLQNKQ